MAWLGVHFTYNIELSNKKDFFDKLDSVKKTLIVWSQTDLSLNGRIDIVKTLVLSKLVFISSVMETPKNFVRFYLEAKTRQDKKDKLIKNKADGGLGMRDFVLFDKALKITWVKRLCSASFLSTVSGTDLFQCNYDYNPLAL